MFIVPFITALGALIGLQNLTGSEVFLVFFFLVTPLFIAGFIFSFILEDEDFKISRATSAASFGFTIAFIIASSL